MAGRASNPISVNQAPQYGDKTAIDTFRKNTSAAPMTGNPMPQRGAGSHGGGGTQAAPPSVNPKTYNKFLALARAKKTATFWQGMVQANPNPATRFFNYHAQEAYKKAAKDVYKSTPNFE